MLTRQPRVGDLLDGYSGGAFGLYEDFVRIEAVGSDWLVARALDADSAPVFYEGDVEELFRTYYYQSRR